MKKLLLAAALLPAFLLQGCVPVGCGGYSESSSELSLYIVDAADGSPVRAPKIVDDGVAISTVCQDEETAGRCGSHLVWLGRITHVITVEAEGYATQQLEVDLSDTHSAHLAIEMSRVAR